MATQNTNLESVLYFLKSEDQDSALYHKVKELQECYKDRDGHTRKNFDLFLACVVDSFSEDIEHEALAEALFYYNQKAPALRLSVIEEALNMGSQEALQCVIRSTPSFIVMGWDTLGQSFVIFP